MPARSRARRRAFEVLFEAGERGEAPVEVLGRQDRPVDVDTDAYAHSVRLVEGVQAHQERIDELISTYAVGWTLDRMPAVDRTVLRLGAYELLWVDDVPDGVAIAEAVALATDYSTDESPRFVNGLLSRLQELKPSLTL